MGEHLLLCASQLHSESRCSSVHGYVYGLDVLREDRKLEDDTSAERFWSLAAAS